MKQKLLVKYSLIFTVLITIALSLLGLPFSGVNAAPSNLTSTPAIDIRTKLQPYQTPGIESSQSDSRLLKEVPSPSETKSSPPELTFSPAVDIRTKLQPYQIPGIESSQSDGRLLKEAPSSSEVEEVPISAQAQQTFNASADATVLQGYPTQNFGGTIDMWAGYDDSLTPDGRIVRSLIKFDIASLPPDQIITKATLRVYLVSSWDYPNTYRTITTYRVTSNWSESSITWNNTPGYGSAYDSKSIRNDDFAWHEFDVTNLVAAWYSGTYTNYGIMLRGPEVSGSDSSWRGFSTRESSYKPQLVVEYTTSTPNTTPTISGLSDQTLQANTSLDNAIDLWVYASDAESPDSALTFTIANTPDPNAGVSIDTNRYIDINPASGWAGQTGVTIRAADPGGLSDTDAFLVTVSPQESPITRTIYLPLMMKNFAPSSPPPSGSKPVDGHWTGTTSRSQPMSFDVSSGGTILNNFKLKTDFQVGPCSGTTEITIPSPRAITNNQFSGSSGSFSFSGQFNSPTTASGAYAYVNEYIYGCGYFSQSGTWTANRP